MNNPHRNHTYLSGRPRLACRSGAHHFLGALLRPTTFTGPLERVVRRRAVRAALSNTRNASLTEAESGKAFATSGSSTTTFDPSVAKRLWYLPRTAFAKSYSALISATPEDLGFISLAL